MHRVPADAFPKFMEVFSPLENHLAVFAVLNHATPGTIWTDDVNHPRAALMRVHHRFYLSGDPQNISFIASLKSLFSEELIPAGRRSKEEAFGLYFSEGWEQIIPQSVLPGISPIFGLRQYWEIGPDDPCLYPVFREDLRLVEVSEELAADPSLVNREDLLEEMLSERESVEAFLRASFGLCLRSADRIITWCLSEYNLGNRCEVGIATEADYRKQGLAAATGAAFVRLARSRGMERIGWHCWANNTGSWRSAQRIGLRKVCNYPSYLVFFEPALHHAVRGDIALDQGEYATALAALEQAQAEGSTPAWAPFSAACAAARLGDPRAAFHYLRIAQERGFCSIQRLENSEHLRSLRDLPDWKAMVEKLRGQES